VTIPEIEASLTSLVLSQSKFKGLGRRQVEAIVRSIVPSYIPRIPWEKRTLLNADHSIAATTATEVTGLAVQIPSNGTYEFEYSLIVQSANTGNGFKYGVNFTGTSTRFLAHLYYVSTGTTASTGVAEDAVTALTGGLVEGHATITLSTTAPNLGPTTGVATADTDVYVTVKGKIQVSNSGDLELWMGSEAAVAVRTEAGSSVIVRRIE
jgi:hypothetical protein